MEDAKNISFYLYKMKKNCKFPCNITDEIYRFVIVGS